jgi:DNA polymerase delta subunit 1
MYTRPDKPDGIDTKGIQLVRRDSCPLVKQVSTAVLEAIMYRKDKEAALDAARRHVVGVLSGVHDVRQFVISKQLRGDYKNDKQPHLYVARKMAERRGHPVPSGSRVPYVFVETPCGGDPESLQAEKAEDPEYAVQHGLALDLLYYLDHQLASPVCALLEVLVDDPQTAVFGHDSVKPLLDPLRAKRAQDIKTHRRVTKNRSNKQTEITKYFRLA